MPYLVLFYICKIIVINITSTLFSYRFIIVCVDLLWQCYKPNNQVNKVL